MREAFHICRTGRPGPVLVDLPKDVTSKTFETVPDDTMDIPGYHVPEGVDRKGVEKLAALLKTSRRPLLYVGQGAIISGAHREVQALAEKLHAPVTTTLGLVAVASAVSK